jgi:hypothetical protein
MRLILLTAVLVLAAAAPASADSLVFIRGDNIWLSNPDGTGQFQVTFDGTAAAPYESPSQSDDGTIVAIRETPGTRRQIYRMTQGGALLNPPINTPAPGTGAIDAKVSPDGRLVAYWFVTTVQDPTCVYCVNLASRVLISHSDSFTRHDEPGLTPNTGILPTWVSNDALLLSQGSAEMWFYRRGAVEGWRWWGDNESSFPNGIRNLTDGDVARTGDRLAIVRGDSQETIVLYTNNGFPPPTGPTTAPTPRCTISGPVGGKFAGPSWSTDGSVLAFQDGAGVTTLRPNLSSCALTDEHMIAGATSPDLSPAAINPGPRPPCGQPGNPAACPPPACSLASLRCTPPPCATCAPSLHDMLAVLVNTHSKLRIRALRRGVRIAFTASGAGLLTARLSKGRTVLAGGSHRYARAGKGSVTLKLSRKGKKALRRTRRLTATLTLTFTPRGGRATRASGRVVLRR